MKLGSSNDLAEAIAEEFVKYQRSVKEEYESEYKRRIQAAKQICLEEVKKEKARLARKVEVYLESKQTEISEAANRIIRSEESESSAKLKQIRGLLEGIDIGGDSDRDSKIEDLENQVGRLRKAVQTFREERDSAVEKANRANKIAESALTKSQSYEQKLRRNGLLESKKPWEKDEDEEESDSKPKEKKKAPPFMKKKDGEDSEECSESVKPNRKVIGESRVKRGAQKSTQSVMKENSVAGDNTILSIAEQLDENI